MALEDQPVADDVGGEHDRWWWVGPSVAVTVLGTLGALAALVLLFNLGILAWFAANEPPDDWCPPGVTCVDDVNVLSAVPQLLIPLAVLAAGWVLALLSFRGPTTVDHRSRRWTFSVIATGCSVAVFAWLFV
jgi:hypothetical protein